MLFCSTVSENQRVYTRKFYSKDVKQMSSFWSPGISRAAYRRQRFRIRAEIQIQSLPYGSISTDVAYLWLLCVVRGSDVGLNRLEQLQKILFDKPKAQSVDVESVRLVNTTSCHETLRRLDRRAPATEKHFIMDMSTTRRMQAVLHQVIWQTVYAVQLTPTRRLYMSFYFWNRHLSRGTNQPASTCFLRRKTIDLLVAELHGLLSPFQGYMWSYRGQFSYNLQVVGTHLYLESITLTLIVKRTELDGTKDEGWMDGRMYGWVDEWTTDGRTGRVIKFHNTTRHTI